MIIPNPIKEIIIWFEYIINFLPGKIGKVTRIFWFSIRTRKIFRVRVDTGCRFIMLSNIDFGKGVGISRNCSFLADGGKIYIGDKIIQKRL